MRGAAKCNSRISAYWYIVKDRLASCLASTCSPAPCASRRYAKSNVRRIFFGTRPSIRSTTPWVGAPSNPPFPRCDGLSLAVAPRDREAHPLSFLLLLSSKADKGNSRTPDGRMDRRRAQRTRPPLPPRRHTWHHEMPNDVRHRQTTSV